MRRDQQTSRDRRDRGRDIPRSTGTARDFADRCGDPVDDLDYELGCARIAIDFWSEAPAHAASLAEALRELAAEHERHAAGIADLQRRMIELTNNEASNHHLDERAGHHQNQLRLQTLRRAGPAAGPKITRFQLTTDMEGPPRD